MTLVEFDTALQHHDWYYEFSEDPKVRRNGLINFNRLKELANSDEAFSNRMDQYKKWKFNSGPRPIEI